MDRHVMATRNANAYTSIRASMVKLVKGRNDIEGLNNSLEVIENKQHRDAEVSAMLQLEALAGLLQSLSSTTKASGKPSVELKTTHPSTHTNSGPDSPSGSTDELPDTVG